MATPSSKNNPGATPTQFTSSPHPSGVPMGRGLSHKSPSMRTPSVSGHGHQQHPSTSSHQYPTPLAATAAADDTAMFSSPSALLALGLGGLTPSPAGNDGLAGQGMNEAEPSSMGMPRLGGIGGPRNLDEEKRRRLDEVIMVLRTRVAGRGVCREGVERLGRLEGFECMWQDNNLTIAGNSVDLEIEFEPDSEYVKDVSLRYATPDAPEGDIRVEASAVLKGDLIQPETEKLGRHWRTLDAFHANLQQLAKMDKLSRDVNCFEAIEGVYESLKRIFESEKQRSHYNGAWEHVCRGNIGRPGLHQRRRVGLSVEYWAERRRMLDSAPPQDTDDHMSLDEPQPSSENAATTKPKTWGATIECEEGYPSLRVSKDWVAQDVFTAMETDEGSQTSPENNSGLMLINWTDPPPTLVTPTNNVDSMAVDSTMLNSAAPNRRFVAKLEPPVDIPMATASEVYRILGVNMPQEYKLNMFDGLIIPSPPSSADDELGGYEQLDPSEKTSQRSVYTFDNDGQPVRHRHSCTFNAVEQVAGRTLRELPFSHPRQLADVLPILRQYALLSSLLRRVFSSQDKADNNNQNTDSKPSSDKTTGPPCFKTEIKRGMTYMTNVSPNLSKLNSILGNSTSSSGSSGDSSTTPSGSPPEDRKIDISLRTPLLGSPSILLLFKAPSTANETNKSRQSRSTSVVTVTIDIAMGGRISISNVTGLWGPENDDAAGGDGEEAKSRALLCQKLGRVLESCEDLGLLVEWIVQWIGRLEKGS